MAEFKIVPSTQPGMFDIVRTIRENGTALMQWFSISEAELNSRIDNGG